MMLKWDLESHVSFKPDGHTLHDFDKRFQLEDEGYFNDKKFNWKVVKNPYKQLNFFNLQEDT